MSAILADLSVPALVAAIEANLFALFSRFRVCPHIEVHEDPDMLWTITSIPFPVFNSVLHPRLTPDTLDAAIDVTIDRCRARHVPMLWWTGPATRPADLGIHLEQHGFGHEEDETGMAADLMKLNEGVSTLSGLTIEQVSDRAIAKQWCRIFTIGFGFPESVGPAFLDLFASFGFGPQSPIRHYLGRLNGEPVATSSLFFGAGVAGVYDVATIPDARRQGIGAAMTLFPLCEARRLGYLVGILQASDMSVSIYRHLGFQEYCKIGQYVWAGEQSG